MSEEIMAENIKEQMKDINPDWINPANSKQEIKHIHAP